MSRWTVLAGIAVAALLVGCQAPQPGSGGSPSSPGSQASSKRISPTPTASGTPSTTCTNLRTWSLTRLAEQVVAVPVSETAVGSVAPELATGAGGLLLFGSQAPADLAGQLARASAGAPEGIRPLVMTDEEGGTVQRMANLVGWLPSARTMAATMTAARIERLAAGVGARMRANGVTMDLAPVLDLDARSGPNDDDAIGTRSFSSSASLAATAGVAFQAGLRQSGVVPVLKHFPGIGSANGNTDLGPAADPPWSAVQGNDLLPFQAAIRAGAQAVMISNASVPGLTNGPASLSSAVISGVLRNRLGFTGLVLTDSLSAGAVQAAGYDVPRAAAPAIAAGADLVLFTALPAQTQSVTEQVVQAIAGTVPTARLLDAARHVLTTKHVNLCQVSR